jgi:hypothetical protein
MIEYLIHADEAGIVELLRRLGRAALGNRCRKTIAMIKLDTCRGWEGKQFRAPDFHRPLMDPFGSRAERDNILRRVDQEGDKLPGRLVLQAEMHIAAGLHPNARQYSVPCVDGKMQDLNRKPVILFPFDPPLPPSPSLPFWGTVRHPHALGDPYLGQRVVGAVSADPDPSR